MPKTVVSKKIEIEDSKENIKKTITNLEDWQPWSPWIICEPKAKVEVTDNGKFYTWEGKRIGVGNMRIVNEQENKIEYDLNFLKPWKSRSKVVFELHEKDEKKTTVVWKMFGSLPFFLFWMKKRIEAFVGMDYDRGLKMLKEYIEIGEVSSKLENIGKQMYKGCNYIGKKQTSNFSDLGKDMESSFTELENYIRDTNLKIDGMPFSQYHKFDVVGGKVVYTVGIPVIEFTNQTRESLIKGILPSMPLYTVRHHGSYQHLGNGWSMAMAMIRNKEFKPIKGIHPIEFYLNEPAKTPSKELKTDICFAI